MTASVRWKDVTSRTYLVSATSSSRRRSDGEKKKLHADENILTRVWTFLFSFSASVYTTGSQPKALAATSDNTVFVVGVDTVEAVRNNQKVAELRPGASASASGASATAIAAAGSSIAIGFGVGWQSSPRMPGYSLTPSRLLSFHPLIRPFIIK